MDAAVNPSTMDRGAHPETLEQPTPTFLRLYISSGINILQSYGWYLFGASLLCLYVWNKIKPYVYKLLKDRDDRIFAARYHKDPDIVYRRQEALDSARHKLEQKYEVDAARAAERRKELEEKKRQEWLQRQQGISSGHRLNDGLDQQPSNSNNRDANSTKKKHVGPRTEYNPLMGNGGSGGYRPSRRSNCPSGGCG